MESSNVIFSKTRDENYLAYLFIELILVFVITSVGTGLLIFFSVGRADSQRNTNNIEFLFENPFIYVLICLTAAIIAMGLILHFRNRNYIVGYAFNNETLSLRLSYRGLLKKDIKSIEIPYSELLWKDLKERNFLFNQVNRGKRIKHKNQSLYLDFISNNFIWEKQVRQKYIFFKNSTGWRRKRILTC